MKPARSLWAFAGLSIVAAGAWAQMPDAQQIPLKEQLALCRSGHTWETQKACIDETRAAYQARRSGTISSSSDDFVANALSRCNIYQDQENVLACRARVMGLGAVTGSVAGGGLLRSYEYQVPASSGQQAEAGQQPPTQSLGAPSASLGEYQPMRPILGLQPAFPLIQGSPR